MGQKEAYKSSDDSFPEFRFYPIDAVNGHETEGASETHSYEPEKDAGGIKGVSDAKCEGSILIESFYTFTFPTAIDDPKLLVWPWISVILEKHKCKKVKANTRI